jgi:ankyrin repeat protein
MNVRLVVHVLDTSKYIAAQKGHAEVTSLLLEKGADVNQAQKDGWGPLCIAAQVDRAEVASLLLEKGAHLNKAMDNGDTPLMIAACNGKEEVLKLLLLWGAEKAAKNDTDMNALDWAREKKHPTVAKLLQ